MSFDIFVTDTGHDVVQERIARLLWNILQKRAFVPDFKPHPNDNLAIVYGAGPEEVRDEIVAPILDKLSVDTSCFDFSGFDFSSIKTAKDALRFVGALAQGSR